MKQNISLSYLTKGNACPEGKLRVYCSYHPEDFAYIERIAGILWEVRDCAVYYYDYEANGEPDREQLARLLGEMQLVVVPLTIKLLKQPNTARDFEIAYAKEKQIPLLHLPRKSDLAASFQAAFGNPVHADAEFGDDISALYRKAGYSEQEQSEQAERPEPGDGASTEESAAPVSDENIGDWLAENIRKGDSCFLLGQFRTAVECYTPVMLKLFDLHKQDETRYSGQFGAIILRLHELDMHFRFAT